jgi:hypothetical protein
MKLSTICGRFAIGEVQNGVILIDLVKSFHHFNKYFVAKIGFDTAEKKSRKVWIITSHTSHVERLVGARLCSQAAQLAKLHHSAPSCSASICIRSCS